ncbi:diacylglycerol kinase delta-like [Physella acuta]|uniref:diacylglycerol kinase delta-like n=1 Tax=Physella acuta TaxID=109671 RepID=UPI0027DC8C3A|nr:diacylglycerol kinase delta-like [Physella acuta]
MAASRQVIVESNEKVLDFIGQEESSDSDNETEPARIFHRRISTNKDIKTATCIKDGLLFKQTTSFNRWKKRYFKLKGRRLYYTKNRKSAIFNEIDITNLSVAECSTRNINHSFQVITPSRNIIVCAESRRDMEEWINALKMAANKEYYEQGHTSHSEMMSGQHNWYACSHARPTYCNVCREALSGVTSHGLSCEVCKFKAHKRCAIRASTNCKWTALASIGKDIIEDDDGISMPHQWMEGNLPVSAKCFVCDKTCGSVLRLQDWRCLWCRAMVHSLCKDQMSKKCPLGQCRVSILPPTAISSIDSDGYWEGRRPQGTSPLLVYVNTKSGDNQGVKFLRRFKQLLNPAQVFDLMNGGPFPGLKLFQRFDSFRILICGGDGSVGWVLSEIDKLDLHRQCQVGVLPFGTGNDLARVLGWGSTFDDDTQLPGALERLEHAQIKMLDRWSIMAYEGNMPPPRKLSLQIDAISQYEDSMANHLTKILHSEDHQVVIKSAKILCETVKAFVAKVSKEDGDGDKEAENRAPQFQVLNEKLQSLLDTLAKEAKESKIIEDSSISTCEREIFLNKESYLPSPAKLQVFKSREALMSRANSLKKAVRQIIEHTERAVDEQNAQTIEFEKIPMTSMIKANEASRSAPSFSVFSEDIIPVSSTGLESYETSSSPLSPASRRISSMSTFNRSSSVDSKLGTPPVSKCKEEIHYLPAIRLPFLQPMALPGISSSIAKNLAGASFISTVLLANADALCAAASPLVEQDIPLDSYQERCVMNNYFGIGLDAKIALEFQNKRDEHPEKCRSRTKNMMWYGVLGGKEMINQTFKNLDQRVLLECDGQRIPLPSLQGIVILNIPSYGGGANFWGGSKQDENFSAPSFDDRILEVVAVFGGIQMAMSRVIDLQHHRIAQCRTVKVSILGDEGVPVQVDGEAWIQPPGYVRIVHKNRSQMLIRDRTFENVLKSWSEKQKTDRPVSPHPISLSEDETQVLLSFIEATSSVIRSVKVAAKCHSSAESELIPLAEQTLECVDKLYPVGRLTEIDSSESESYQPTLVSQVVDLVQSVRILYHQASIFLTEKSQASIVCIDKILSPSLEERLTTSLISLEEEMKRMIEMIGLMKLEVVDEMTLLDQHKRKQGRFKQVYSKLKGRGIKDKQRLPPAFEIRSWTLEEVGQWLESLALGEYKESFFSHEITGAELLNLERRDLKDLGVTKVGHLKRIQQGIKELHHREAAYDRPSS